MKAVLYKKYGPPEVLELHDIVTPIPGESQVLIRNHAVVISATDVIFRRGIPRYTRMILGMSKPKNQILGDALSGTVVKVGSNVEKFKPGDTVYGASGDTMGAYVEFQSLAENDAIAKKPENMNFNQAAAVCDGALVALPFLRDNAKLQSGQKILIIGASGAIGTFAVQLASYYGAEVTGVCSTNNVDLVKSLGADSVIDYSQTDFSKTGETYDVVFDTVGKSSFTKCKKILTDKGIYLTTVLNFSILMQMLLTSKSKGKRAEIAFTGMRKARDKARDLELLKELIEEEKVWSVIDKLYPIEDIVEAHHHVEAGHKRGSVLVILDHLHQ